MAQSNLKRILSIFCFGIIILCSSYALVNENPLKWVGKKSVRLIKKAVYGDNFHAVDSTVLYRSRQLSAKKLETYLKTYDIKTIINLRHPEENLEEWNQEKLLVEQNGVLFFNIPMDANIITPKDKVEQLIALFLAAPAPILVHCYAGSDRTGEACALYKLLNGSSSEEALKQLSLKFGHSTLIYPKKQHLIKKLDSIYPAIIENIKKICPSTRLTVNELKHLTTEEFLESLKAAK